MNHAIQRLMLWFTTCESLSDFVSDDQVLSDMAGWIRFNFQWLYKESDWEWMESILYSHIKKDH